MPIIERISRPFFMTSKFPTFRLPPDRGERQAIIRIVVDFPAPFSPKIEKVSPSTTSNEILSTAVKFR
jgi:hypothetical protein